MKDKVMLVEDNLYILKNIKILLELNEYHVVTARNGAEALKQMSSLQIPPDLIISDIIMPEMNGYDLLQKISENYEWNLIPFIFISAKSSPEDVRFGKKLGTGDYIAKPFKEEELLAIIEGKIIQSKNQKLVSNKIRIQLLNTLKIDFESSLTEKSKNQTVLFLMMWDEISGPVIKGCYPEMNILPLPIETIGIKLFQTVVSIYGKSSYYEPEGVLLRITNIEMDCSIYFDTIFDDKGGGKRQFMLVFLSPRINYLESIRIKEVLQNLASQVKKEIAWNIENFWYEIVCIVSKPVIQPI